MTKYSRTPIIQINCNGEQSEYDNIIIRIIGFFFEYMPHWQSEVAFYYLQYVPASKPFDHAWFEVLEAITLYWTWSDNEEFQGQFSFVEFSTNLPDGPRQSG